MARHGHKGLSHRMQSRAIRAAMDEQDKLQQDRKEPIMITNDDIKSAIELLNTEARPKIMVLALLMHGDEHIVHNMKKAFPSTATELEYYMQIKAEQERRSSVRDGS